MTTKPTSTTERETRVWAGGEVRAVKADGKTTLHGYAAVYDQRSLPIYGMFYEIVRRGAFARALKGEDDVCALVEHDSGRVIGRNRAKTLRLSDDEKGLKFEIDLPDTTDGRDLATSIDRGDISQMSFGFRKIKDRWTEERPSDGILVETRALLEVELFDVSPVAWGQYPQTEVALRSRQEWRESLRTGADVQRLARLRLAEAER